MIECAAGKINTLQLFYSMKRPKMSVSTKTGINQRKLGYINKNRDISTKRIYINKNLKYITKNGKHDFKKTL